MKKIILFFLSMVTVTSGFAERFTLDNQISNLTNNKKSKLAIQWVSSAKELEESNNMVKQGLVLNQNALHVLTQRGKTSLNIPKKAEYFRVLSWSTEGVSPDALTNWVEIVPNKIYTLNKDHLYPLSLMSGMGC